MIIISLLIAIVIPLLFLYVVFQLDLYRTGSFKWVVAILGSGCLAYGLAYLINSRLRMYGLITSNNLVRYLAPFLEEILKISTLIILIRQTKFTYFIDGAIYGFAAGIGFAVLENIEYILAFANAGFGVAITRVISTNLVHASASAIVGIFVGIGILEKPIKRVRIYLSGLLLAIFLHFVFNNVISRGVSGSVTLIVAILIGIIGAVIVTAVIKRGLSDEKTWISNKLGDKDRVTSGETAVVWRLEDLDELLENVTLQFGIEKKNICKDFIYKQAHLGISRGKLDKIQDDKTRELEEKYIYQTQQEMEKLRKSAGIYVMLYIRGIFPPESVSVLARLTEKIQQTKLESINNDNRNLFTDLNQVTLKTIQEDGQQPKRKVPGGVFASLDKKDKPVDKK
jgi:RsiW-degrading membrane proteinase PrsW (M82 family)